MRSLDEGLSFAFGEYAMARNRACQFAVAVSFALLQMPRMGEAQSVFVDPRPVLTLGGANPEGTPAFASVVGATRLTDGTIVVADGGANALKFFDQTGRIVRTAGRQGEGPGEFQSLGTVRQCRPDSLFAVDALSRSVTVFTSLGQFARRFQLPGAPSMITCSREGTFAMIRPHLSRPSEGATRQRVQGTLAVADSRGTVSHEAGEIGMLDLALVGRAWLPPPGSGYTRVVVTRRRILVCPLDSASILSYSLAGAALRSIPLGVVPRAPTRRELERDADATASGWPAGTVRDTWRRRLLALAPPSRLPPCNKLIADPDDNVWVVLSFPGDTVTTLRVFAPNDGVLGDIAIAEALDIYEVGQDYLLASGETADGEPWLRMYRVRRAAAR